MLKIFKTLRIALPSVCAAMLAHADTIIFTNGDKLAGHFVRSTGAAVTFKSDALGDLTVDWSKVQELDTTANVAVIRKGVRLRKKQDTSSVPQGTLAEQDKTLRLTPASGTPQSIPVGDVDVVIDQPAFQRAMTRTPGFFQDWNGTVTAGATVVQATQDNRTFNGAVALTRAEPTEDWINPSYRTLINYSQSYGE